MGKESKSILKLLALYIDEMDFKRTGDNSEDEFTDTYTREIQDFEDGSRAVRLSISGERKGCYKLTVRIIGVFKVEAEGSEDLSPDFIETLYHDNAVAIMFPFLRTQVSLLTTQPGIAPHLIPPMNIAKLFSESD